MGKDDNPFVAIVAVSGGIFLVVVVMFLIFAREALALLVPLAWAFVALGCIVAFFTLLASKKK